MKLNHNHYIIAAIIVAVIGTSIYTVSNSENLTGKVTIETESTNKLDQSTNYYEVSSETPPTGSETYSAGEFINAIYVDQGASYKGNKQGCTDMTRAYKYYKAYQYALENNWISVYSNGKCNPTANINRANAAKITFNAYNVANYTPEKQSFDDVSPDTWMYAYIESLNHIQAFEVSSGEFRPSYIISPNEVAYWMSHLSK